MILTITLGTLDSCWVIFKVFIWKIMEAWSSCLYLPRILLTQPWLTRSCLEMSQGLTPWWASSTILWRTTSGSGRPFTKTPPSWFTPPCPETDQKQKARGRVVRTSHIVEAPLWAPRGWTSCSWSLIPQTTLGSFLKLSLAFVHVQAVSWAIDSQDCHTVSFSY